ncbi:uncharacterized protein LOC116352618 [Contarinia nasturtii]|uniref:uncharacterized protein LOC116352618 n=1 Tax=Contarinia nasturtii TaxID=265458 RepID=UPI0012D3AEE3|nr:uncharacterized protein LOC116352618 [Contarinia nasturtii]
MTRISIFIIASVLVLGVAVQFGYAASVTDALDGLPNLSDLVKTLKALIEAFFYLIQELPKLTKAVVQLAEAVGDVAKLTKPLGTIADIVNPVLTNISALTNGQTGSPASGILSGLGK